jgi:hypothetical protein
MRGRPPSSASCIRPNERLETSPQTLAADEFRHSAASLTSLPLGPQKQALRGAVVKVALVVRSERAARAYLLMSGSVRIAGPWGVWCSDDGGTRRGERKSAPSATHTRVNWGIS